MLNDYNDVLEVRDLCKIFHISKKSAYQLLQSGQLPHKRIGRIYKISKAAVITYLTLAE